MPETAETLARIAAAAERIAGALESIARANLDSGPRPQLTVARSPSDASGLGAVNLSPDGALNAIIQNTGAAETTLINPVVEIASVQATGGIVQRDGQPQPAGTVPAAPNGPGVSVIFKLEAQSHLLAELPLTLRLPHRPGRFPGITVLEVDMEPTGEAGGRPGWRVANTREMAPSDADA
jgi:hypothetical protein